MPKYNLNLIVEKADLEQIKNAKQRIMLAKPVNGGEPNTVWLSIDPFESNDVSWKEEYGLYASTTEIVHGASIAKISETGIPAEDGALYDIGASHVFKGPEKDKSIKNGTFAAFNDVPYENYPSLTFGLTQSALVNKKPENRKPISASSVLSQQQIEITPYTEVYIWLQADFESETIITKITGKHAVAKFGGGVNDITMQYHPKTGLFAQNT